VHLTTHTLKFALHFFQTRGTKKNKFIKVFTADGIGVNSMDYLTNIGVNTLTIPMKRLSSKLLIGMLCLVSTTIFSQQNYYWVGGTGDWTDLTHWATASGGSTKRTNIPTSLDDVFFDANSFTGAAQKVTITDGANCHNMNWTGVTNAPTINAFVGDALNIYGSLTLPSTVTRDFMGYLHFKGTTTGNTVDLGGLPLRNPVNEQIYFEGIGGAWTITSKLETYFVYHTAGTLNTNGQQIVVSGFISSGTNTRVLNLGASAIDCPTWNISSATGLTINAGTSTITSSFQFTGKGFTYNNLVVNGTSKIVDNNTFNTITLNAGATLNITSGSNQTLTNLVSNGTSGSLVTIKSTTAGSTSTLTKSGGGTVTINYASIQDNTASPAATFTANNSGDAGNNTNWSFTNPLEPTTQTSSLSLFSVTSGSVRINWTNGNGTKRLVVAKVTSTATNTAPVDGTVYTAAAFGSGTTTATGEYVVYSGTGSTATITGLSAATAYNFKVYEFNSGTGSAANYLTTSPPSVNATTLPSTAVIMSNSPVSVCSGNYYSTGGANGSTPLYYSNSESFTQTLSSSTAGSKVRLTFSSFSTSGSGDVLKIYDGANTSAPLIGSYSSSTSPGTITATNAAGQLTLQWTSDANIVSTGWIAAISCIVLDTEPTVGAVITSGSTGSIALGFNWTNGNGSKRIVVARQGSAVTGFTPVDGTDYVANASYGSGTAIAGNYVVYNGSGSSLNLTNLTPGTTYYFSIYEYNGANTSANYRPTATNTSVTTTSQASEPTIAASNVVAATGSLSLNVTFSAGNGAARVVVVKQGSPVNVFPSDGFNYTNASPLFTSAPDLGSGNKIVYSGTGTNVIVSGLTAGTIYHVAVFEFNGTSPAGSANYLTTTYPTTSETTRAATPTTPATQFVITQNFTSLKFSWTNGNGARRIAVLEKPSVSKSIVNGTTYVANSVFGQGSSVGTNAYVVYDGTGNNVEVTGLQSYQNYVLSIYEYNGAGQYISYLTSGTTAFTSTFRYKPTLPSTNLVSSNVTSNSADLSWTRGNGDYVVVLGRETTAIDSYPYDSTVVNYPYSTAFGAGATIGNSVVLYKGTGNSFTVTQLNPTSTYHFAVIELNAVSVNSNTWNYFLTTNVPTTSVQTSAGKNFYWVGGKGKWSELTHWATTSGGSTNHTSVPTSSDNVYFDGNSFNSDADSVLIDIATIKCHDMDWTGTTKKASLIASNVTGSICWVNLFVNGSLKLVKDIRINIAEINFTSSTKGNIIDLAGKTSTTISCSSSFKFDGVDGEWTLMGKINVSYLVVRQGKLFANKFQIDAGTFEFFYLPGKKASLDLQNSQLNCYSINYGNNGTIVGGTINLNRSNENSLTANGASYRKVVFNGFNNSNNTIIGGATIDSLVVNAGQRMILESGKTLNIGTLILNGDTTRSTFIKSTIPGSAATISKSSGTVDVSYVFIGDNIATGGATFNAKNSINKGNVTGWNFTTPTLFAPKNSASAIILYKVLKTQVKMRWKSGDGMMRIVVMKEGSAVDRSPVNNLFYTSSSIFASGTDIGNKNYSVYNGTADSVVVNGLTPGKTYHVAVYEYNSWGGAYKYRTDIPARNNIQTPNSDDIIIDNTPVSSCNVRFYDEGGKGYYKNGKPFTQTITPSPGTKLGVIFNYIDLFVLDTLLIFDGPDTSAPLLAKLVSTKPAQPITAQNSAGALTFMFKPHLYTYSGSYVGWEAELYCAGTPAGTEPTTQPSAIIISNETSTSMKVNFIKGNGEGRLVVARAGSAVSKSVIDGVDFKADPSFGNGSSLGDGNYVVYTGANETFDLSGLQSNTIYHFAAFEFNGTGNSKNYLITNPGIGKDTTFYAAPNFASSTLTFPLVTATSISYSMFTGNGTGRLILMKKGGPITAIPEDGKEYIFGNTFSDNSMVIASSSFLSGSSISSLDQLTTYYFKVFEYNGNGARRVYLTTLTASGSATTKGPTMKLAKLSANYCPQSTIEASFTINGAFDNGNKFLLELSNESGSFDSPAILKDSSVTVQSGTMKGTIPGSIVGGNGYKVRIVSTSPVVVSDSIRIINIPIVPTPTFTVADSTFTTTNPDGNQWARNGQLIAGATGTSYHYKLGGIYTLIITQNGCSKVSEPYLVTRLDNVLGERDIQLFPNPVRNEMVINLGSVEDAEYVISDIRGAAIIRGNTNAQRVNVNTSSLTPGMYLIRIHTQKKVTTKTFIKE
jgi:hypothetical protein